MAKHKYWDGTKWVQTAPSMDEFFSSGVHYADDIGIDNWKNVIIPNIVAYTKGISVSFVNKVTNTGDTHIRINDLANVRILSSKQAVLKAGDLQANVPYTIRYNGTSFFLQGEGGDYNIGDKIPYAKLGFTEPVQMSLSKGPNKSENSVLIGKYEDVNFFYYVQNDSNSSVRVTRVDKITGATTSTSIGTTSAWGVSRNISPSGYLAVLTYHGARIWNAGLGQIATSAMNYYEIAEFDSENNLYITNSGGLIRWNAGTTTQAWFKWMSDVTGYNGDRQLTILSDWLFVINVLQGDKKTWRLERRDRSTGNVNAYKQYTQTAAYTLRIIGNDKNYLYITDDQRIYQYDFNMNLVSTTVFGSAVSVHGDYTANVIAIYTASSFAMESTVTLYRPQGMILIEQLKFTSATVMGSTGSKALIDSLGDIYTMSIFGNAYDTRTQAIKLLKEVTIKA